MTLKNLQVTETKNQQKVSDCINIQYYLCCSAFQRYRQRAAANLRIIKSCGKSKWRHADSVHRTGITHIIANI